MNMEYSSYKTVCDEDKQSLVLLKQLVHLNDSRSKTIVVGLHYQFGFYPLVHITPSTGNDVKLDHQEWTEFVRELTLLNTYIFDLVDVNSVQEKQIGQYILFVQTYSGLVNVGLRSVVDKSIGIFLGQVSCMNVVKYSQYITYILEQYRMMYKVINSWYIEFILRIKTKYQQTLIEAKCSGGEKLTKMMFVKDYIDNIQIEEKYLTENLTKIIYELGCTQICSEM